MTDNEAALLDALGEVNEQRKLLDKKEKELRSALGPVLSEAGSVVATDKYAFTVKTNPGRRTLDKEALLEAGIDLDPYYKVGKPFVSLSISRVVA